MRYLLLLLAFSVNASAVELSSRAELRARWRINLIPESWTDRWGLQTDRLIHWVDANPEASRFVHDQISNLERTVATTLSRFTPQAKDVLIRERNAIERRLLTEAEGTVWDRFYRSTPAEMDWRLKYYDGLADLTLELAHRRNLSPESTLQALYLLMDPRELTRLAKVEALRLEGAVNPYSETFLTDWVKIFKPHAPGLVLQVLEQHAAAAEGLDGVLLFYLNLERSKRPTAYLHFDYGETATDTHLSERQRRLVYGELIAQALRRLIQMRAQAEALRPSVLRDEYLAANRRLFDEFAEELIDLPARLHQNVDPAAWRDQMVSMLARQGLMLNTSRRFDPPIVSASCAPDFAG